MSLIPEVINFSITRDCNKFCSFCINSHLLDQDKLVTLSDYKLCIDFLVANACKTVRFIGGEPTTHPELNQMVDYAYSKIKVDVVSNGLFSEELLYSVKDKINTISVGFPGDVLQYEVIKKNLALIKKFNLSHYLYFVIEDLSFDVGKILSIIKDLDPSTVSLKIALPNITKGNKHIKNPMNTLLGAKIYFLVNALHKLGIRVFNTCFIPVCCFEPIQYNWMREHTDMFGHPGCFRNSIYDLIIDYNLDFYTCPETDRILGNVKDTSNLLPNMLEILNDDFIYKVNFRCINCGLRNDLCIPCASYGINNEYNNTHM